jgi:hypothetical protein
MKKPELYHEPSFDKVIRRNTQDKVENGYVTKYDLKVTLSYFEYGIKFYLEGTATFGFEEDNPQPVYIWKSFDKLEDACWEILCAGQLHDEFSNK